MTDETAVTVAEFREVDTVRGSTTMVAPSALDFWQIVPVPTEWKRLKKFKNAAGEIEEVEVDYFVDNKVFEQSTPKHQRKRHFKGYDYTTADFARAQLNKAAMPGRWQWDDFKYEVGDEYTLLVKSEKKRYKPVRCFGYLLVPGYPPVKGEGEAPWAQDDTNDPRFSFVTAKKAASSLALKSAAKLGFNIGADISEDDATAAAVTGVQTTCSSLFDILVKKDKKDIAVKIVNRYTPMALVGDKLMAEAIDEGVMDSLLNELTKASLAA